MPDPKLKIDKPQVPYRNIFGGDSEAAVKPKPKAPKPKFKEKSKKVRKTAVERMVRGKVAVQAVVEPVKAHVPYEAIEADLGPDLGPDPAATAPKKRGRPFAPKPWEDEGISRSTWLRRRAKASKGKKE